MFVRFFRFLARDDGAVTVDWVVLTAAVALLGVAVVGPLAHGSLTLSSGVGGFIAQVPAPTWD